MSALNIFLMVMGAGVTVLVLLGMMVLKPEHIFEDEVLTHLTPSNPPAPSTPASFEPGRDGA